MKAKGRTLIQISSRSSNVHSVLVFKLHKEGNFGEKLMYKIRKKIKAHHQASEELPSTETPSHNFYHPVFLPNIPHFFKMSFHAFLNVTA